MTGTGAETFAGFSLNRKTVPFGFVGVGGNKIDSITVTDTGKAALVISNVTSSNGTFTVNPTSATLQPAQAQTFHITFTPVNTTPQSGNIVFTHNAPGSPDTVAVSGTGAETLAGFSLNRKTVPFGFVGVGGNKLDSITVTDTGKAALVISNVASSNGTFTVNPTSVTLQPAQAQTFHITFTPANTNPQSGNIVFTHNAPGSPDTVAVSGTGAETLAGFSLNRKTVPFGFVGVGGNKLDSITVTDTGKAALVISNVASSNGTFTVNPTSVTLQPAQAQIFHITFTPLNTNPQSGDIVFTHNAPGSPDTVVVTGTGAVAAISLSRKNVPFTSVPLGETGLDSIIVTDTGRAALVIHDVASNNAAFVVNPTHDTLQPGEERAFYIMFHPPKCGPAGR